MGNLGSLDWEDPLDEDMANHSSILGELPGESPWTEEPGRLEPMGSQRVGYDWATKHTHTHEERNLQSLSECGSQIERSDAVIWIMLKTAPTMITVVYGSLFLILVIALNLLKKPIFINSTITYQLFLSYKP